MATALSVNLNKVALLRNARGRDFPSVEAFAHSALQAGAVGVTIHPRPDQRHARYSDVSMLKTLLADYPDCELNIEGNPDEAFLEVVMAVKPHQCTLVPDAPDQITSDHGWDLSQSAERLAPILAQLKAEGIRSSVFMDPEPSAMAAAAAVGADRVELYTESYAEAYAQQATDLQATLSTYAESAKAAHAAGLGVNAGHDLDLRNLPAFLRAVPEVLEVSIGHALTVESLWQGWEATVSQYAKICADG